ncbi:MAG: class I SAM-dependent methyltransferase [Myxococcales bacterium]
MAAIAALLGFPAASPRTCRVLELGAGDGAHLIPLALEQPGASFVGIDLAGSAIARGQALVQELGLKNIRLEQGDLSTFDAAEPFDYVIAHGVYSWVPPEVQTLLLSGCRSLLAPQGLAYISYATYPGCHQREMVRNMMLFHTARLAGGSNVVSEGHAFAQLVRDHQTAGEAYGSAIQQELTRMQQHGVGYAFHDDFAEHNSPVYFGEMAERVREQGLEFFAESLFSFFDDARLSADVLAMVEKLGEGDLITREQYLDFLRGRAFRQSLFCHVGARPTAPWQLEALTSLSAASPLLSTTPELAPRVVAPETFVSPAGVQLTAESRVVRHALRELGQIWPRSLPVAELLGRALAAHGSAEPTSGSERQLLLRTLLRAAAVKLVELDVAPPAVAENLSESPLGSPLARLEARQGLTVTDLWHRRLKLDDEAGRFLLTLLDGSRTRAELLELMVDFFAQQASPTPPGRPQVEAELAKVLLGMQRRALLLR